MQNKSLSNHRLVATIVVLLTALTIFILDQFTKSLVLQNLSLYSSWEPIPALGRLVKISYTSNSGAAFGLFTGGGNVFMVVAAVVAFAIGYYVITYPNLPWLVQLSLGMMMGGALGNMWDRILHGSVTDFVDIGFWPIFNVADSSIVIGVALLAFWMWQEDMKEQSV